MESNSEQNQLDCDKVSEGDAIIMQNGNDTSDSEDDDAFFNQLFTGATPKFVPTDAVPWLDDSDSDAGASETVVKFYVDKSNSVPLAQYGGIEYRVGFLDLTQEEYSCLGVISETTVELSVNEKSISLHDNKFYIKRIDDRQEESSNSNNIVESWFERLNLVCIKFSTTEPLLAKYENHVYFVGEKLSKEYMSLLNRTKRKTGTAIRINKNRLKVDRLNQLLDVNRTHSFRNENEFCVISGLKDSTKSQQDDWSINEISRFVICHDPCMLLKVEPQLMHASISDESTEIYAETDFPFMNSERIHQTVGKLPPPKEKRKREVKEEQKKNQKKDENNDAGNMLLDKLKPYLVPNEIIDLFNEERSPSDDLFYSHKENYIRGKLGIQGVSKLYQNQRKTMIYLEELGHSLYLEEFDRTKIKLTHMKDRQFRFPITDELSELVTEIGNNSIDYVILQPRSKIDSSNQMVNLLGQICGIKSHQIIIEIYPKSIDQVRNSYKTEVYDIFFELNRLRYQLQHCAWDFICEQDLFVRLIDNTAYRCKVPVTYHREHVLKEEGTMLEHLNIEQKSAITNIITKKDPYPYIIIGPPGTGKTHTLIGLIEQIVKTTQKNVLVCAISNASCDAITDSLIDVVNKNEIYRFFGDSCKYPQTSARIGGSRVSNLNGTEIHCPTLQFLYQFRVIVCTLSSAGFLTRNNVNKRVWSADHFEYVIIDDCASAPQSMSMIPIAGLCTSLNKPRIHAQIILTGDPKQLKITARSSLARKMGYEKSWMEDLCELSLYSRNEETGKFNEMYTMHLTKNYRSHPGILRIPNELFYENTIVALAKDGTNRRINSELLPSEEFPFILKSIQGDCQHVASQSWYNQAEIDEVVQTIKTLSLPHSQKKENRENTKIKQGDIGVVAPYQIQCDKISQILRGLMFSDVTVGTADVFQGKEKLVMIISTVRAGGELGIVASPNWLNFVMTRAMDLVVVIGDSRTLKSDANWKRIIELNDR